MEIANNEVSEQPAAAFLLTKEAGRPVAGNTGPVGKCKNQSEVSASDYHCLAAARVWR